MKLAASLIVAENERGRYLHDCVGSLLEFCDEVVLLFDGDGDWSTELMGAWGDDGARVVGVTPGQGEEPVNFFAHEGRARQRLFDATLARDPTHVLAIDADEFVADGGLLRSVVEARPGQPLWSLEMEEVWELDGDCLCVREDGGWRSHPVALLYAVDVLRERSRIADRALACGRIPVDVTMNVRAARSGTEVLHFGWANERERSARHHRYVVADGGRFHASQHLDSIMWPPERVVLEGREWPAGLHGRRASIESTARR